MTAVRLDGCCPSRGESAANPHFWSPMHKSRVFHGARPNQRVGSGGFQNASGRVGSGQEVLNFSRIGWRIGSDQIGSGRVRRCSKSHGSGRVTLTRSDPRAMTRAVKSRDEKASIILQKKKSSGDQRLQEPRHSENVFAKKWYTLRQ